MEQPFESNARMLANATREHPRFQANSKLRLHWTDASSQGSDFVCSCDAVCTDVAVGGIGAYTVTEFVAGDVVGVEFLDAPLPIYQARVIYRNGFDYGLQFLDIV